MRDVHFEYLIIIYLYLEKIFLWLKAEDHSIPVIQETNPK